MAIKPITSPSAAISTRSFLLRLFASLRFTQAHARPAAVLFKDLDTGGFRATSEREALVEMMVEDFLGDFGYSVVEPIETLQATILLAATEKIDVAVVDINTSGKVATAVVDKLIEREIPFLLISGYENMRGTRYASIPSLRRPFDP